MTARMPSACHVFQDHCQGINGGELVAVPDGWIVTTIEKPGGYSAIMPLHLHPSGEPVRVTVEVEPRFGRIGLSLVDDDMTLLHERCASGPERISIDLDAQDAGRVRALLIRNMSSFPGPSSGHVRAITFAPRPPDSSLVRASSSSAPLDLPLRHYAVPSHGSEMNGTWHTGACRFAMRDVALVVVDAWASHECTGWMQRAEDNMRQRLVPLLAAVRAAGLPIIHAAHDRAPHPLAAPIPGEIVIEGTIATDSFVALLKRLGTKLVVYAGYKSNMCVLTRPIGLLAMHNRGFALAFVRDASIAMETPETLADESLHKAMVNFIEVNLAPTVSSNDLIAAVHAAVRSNV